MPEPIVIDVLPEYNVEIGKIIKRKKVGNKEVVVTKLNAFEAIKLFSEYINILSNR
jgi:hypothetical protein